MRATIDLPLLDTVGDELFAPNAAHGTSLALVVMHRGDVVFERYGVEPASPFAPQRTITAETTLISWSMAKSITHAAVGIALADGLLDLDAPAPVGGWAGTEKSSITLLDLLEMRSGLAFVEDYVDGAASDCLAMLFGEGRADMAAYAASRPLVHPPGTFWSYSSGTTNIVARIVGDALGDRVGEGHQEVERLLRDRLFGPARMTSATATFDDAGTFIGSSYVYATASDFARFGELYRNDGVAADGRRVLPTRWRDHAATFVAVDPEPGPGGPMEYGRHWWRWPDLAGSYACHGYEGQYTLVVPDRELVVVHLGKSPTEQRAPLLDGLRRIVRAIPVADA